MSLRLRIIIGAIALFAPAGIAYAHPTTLTGTCTNWPSPRIDLNWTLPGHRDVNNIEKGPLPAYPVGTWWGFIGTEAPPTGDPRYWGQADVGWWDTSYVDTNVSAGVTYSWRIKTHAYEGSIPYTVKVNACNCGGSCPPTDNAVVSAAAPGTVDTNQPFNVIFLSTNTGTSTWNGSYSLDATNAANSGFWGAATSAATGTVNPGGLSVRVIPFTAPAIPGTYPVAPWRMHKAGPGFFGSASSALSVTVAVPNQPAAGQNESGTCGAIAGWATDPDTAAPLTVRIYRDGAMGVGTLAATLSANQAHAAPHNGYGYSWTPPTDGLPHAYYVYALDPQSLLWTHLTGSPTAAFSCWPPPAVALTSVTQGDYCAGGPEATVNWQYTSPGALPQTQWQLQLATDPAFTAVAYDSGVKPTAPTLPPPSLHSSGTGQGVLQFGTTYWVRVMAWDSQGQASPWSAPLTTATAASAYPGAAFTYLPTQVFAGQQIQFTDTSTNGPTLWAWDFGDGQVGNGPNPAHIFAAQGSYPVRLDATNAVGTCSTTKVLDTKQALPTYREVRPGSGQ